MDKKEYKYEINGTTYIQRPLKLGQIKQLSGVLEGMSVSMLTSETELARLLIANIGPAIAIVITEEGTRLQDKDIEQLAAEIEFEIDAETVARVVQDFFACNPVASVYEKLSGMVKGMKQGQPGTGSTGSVSSSPQETLQNGMTSSGDTPRESAFPGSSTDHGT